MCPGQNIIVPQPPVPRQQRRSQARSPKATLARGRRAQRRKRSAAASKVSLLIFSSVRGLRVFPRHHAPHVPDLPQLLKHQPPVSWRVPPLQCPRYHTSSHITGVTCTAPQKTRRRLQGKLVAVAVEMMFVCCLMALRFAHVVGCSLRIADSDLPYPSAILAASPASNASPAVLPATYASLSGFPPPPRRAFTRPPPPPPPAPLAPLTTRSRSQKRHRHRAIV